jgi:hypothetical protein
MKGNSKMALCGLLKQEEADVATQTIIDTCDSSSIAGEFITGITESLRRQRYKQTGGNKWSIIQLQQNSLLAKAR